MPVGTRRTHTKTRLGCAQCKKRRIKCDCTHPVCENCEKRGDACSFLLLAPSSRLSLTSTSPILSLGETTIAPSSISGAQTPSPIREVILVRRSTQDNQTDQSSPTESLTSTFGSLPLATPLNFELHSSLTKISPYLRCNDVWKDARETLTPALQGLLYHYEYTTSLSLASSTPSTSDPAKTAWQHVVPELASRHHFLIHHILAVASLHLGRLHGHNTERWTMMNIAATQMNKALTRFRPELENINEDNAAALFASSTLTAVYFFRTSTVDIDEIRACIPSDTIVPTFDVVDKMLDCVLRTIWGLRGPLAVLIPGWMYVMEGKMGAVASRNWWPIDRIPITKQAKEEDRRLAQIENLWIHRRHELGANVDYLASALFYLRETYALVSELVKPGGEYPATTSIGYAADGRTNGIMKDRGAIFFWATRISRDFIKLVEQKNREALVIVAHYAVLAGRVRNAWWLEGLGPNIVIAMAMALGRENWHLIEWPASEIGVDLHNAFTARPDVERKPGEVPMDVV